MLVRLALVVASVAWAGFVFTNTIGDPGRGERIASAVLRDDAARAEIAAPITTAVIGTGLIPGELQPVVATQVDVVLRDPAGARAFIDPFAGSWARLLGEADERSPVVDVAPILDEILVPVIGQNPGGASTFPVPGVPIPSVELGWMASVRAAVEALVLPLTLLAALLFVAAYMIGERARVLRRFGWWAITAGVTWVVIPPILTWIARRWAPGADAVVAVITEEAVSGLVAVALTLMAGGAMALGMALLVGSDAAPARSRDRRPAPQPGYHQPGQPQPGQPQPGQPATGYAEADYRRPATARSVTSTAEIPVTGQSPPAQSAPTTEHASSQPTTVNPSSAPPSDDQPTTTHPVADDTPQADDHDPLWDYYGPRQRPGS